jgi:hypothetical protein
MTQPPDEYGDALRRALRAEADAVVPSPEGLEIIRARIERRGVRNLFWWRAGAAAASALLVAGTIVMMVPGLRSQITEESPVQPAGVESTEVPSNSSTTRSHEPSPKKPVPSRSEVVFVPPESRSPTPRASKTADSTRAPSPSPSPTPTTCPSTTVEPAEPAADCPTATLSPTPTPEETSMEPTACPLEECPPGDVVEETPTAGSSPLLDASQPAP